MLLNQKLRFLLQFRAGGARDDARDPAAVREVAVGGVDDGVDRLVQQIAADDPEDATGGYFFLR
jgi:hypothetical protein